MTEILKHKVQAKAQRIRKYEKRETQYLQNKMFIEDTKKFTETWAQSIPIPENPHLWQKWSLTGSHFEETKHSVMKGQDG